MRDRTELQRLWRSRFSRAAFHVTSQTRVNALMLRRARDTQLLPSQLADESLEARELLRDELDAGLVGEFHLVVELGMRGADEDFRRVEREGVEEHHRLAQVILHARAAHRAARRRLDRDRLVLERLVLDAR